MSKQINKKSKIVPAVLLLFAFVFVISTFSDGCRQSEKQVVHQLAPVEKDSLWKAPELSEIHSNTDSGKLIKYGYELIANTAFYFGPKGIIAHSTNGMNCQNCHLKAGTSSYANNFSKVYSTYPIYRARNNSIQTIYDRINDCFERSMNGKTLDSSSHEMKAIYAYMKWLGANIPHGTKPKGNGIIKLPYLDRAANPATGKIIFTANCQTCHGKNGEGLLNTNGNGYTFPPLWGKHSYNDGAGIHQLTKFAAFIKENMPFGVDWKHPLLKDEEAWDIAAFVNSQPRPHNDNRNDWKDFTKKPIDYPFGPYADTFSEKQHKYGPFKPIEQQHKNENKSN